MPTISNLINTFSSLLPKAQQEPKQSSYLTGRLWTKYASNDMKLTRFSVVNVLARSIFLITALVPTIFLTLATILADAALIAARGVKRAYTALRGASKQESMLNKAIAILTNKKTLIAAGSLAMIAGLGYAGYANREVIGKAAKDLQNSVSELPSKASKYAKESYSKASKYAKELPSNISEYAKETRIYKYINS